MPFKNTIGVIQVYSIIFFSSCFALFWFGWEGFLVWFGEGSALHIFVGPFVWFAGRIELSWLFELSV